MDQKKTLQELIQGLCDRRGIKMPIIPEHIAKQESVWHVFHHLNCTAIYKNEDINLRTGQIKSGRAPSFTLWS